MNRRQVAGLGAQLAVLAVAALTLAASEAGCGGVRHVRAGRRVIVLGVDGLDYGLVRELMARGRMPAFERIGRLGSFAQLRTSLPPQSPVAWSTFITGLDPGGHGIFDFVHRDPKTMELALSTSRVRAPRRNLRIGPWQIPLEGGRAELLREGTSFWEVLEQHGIETSIVRMPANFPPSGSASHELSGMGTPDLLGTYGTFSFFTSDRTAASPRSLSGGVIVPVRIVDGVVRGSLQGPDNPYLAEPHTTHVNFLGRLDESRQYMEFVIGTERRLLRVGEWSDWIPIELPLVAWRRLAAECRVYLKRLDPYVEFYVSPINIDPLRPELPISTPLGWAPDLARATGRFYTQGMPEDTKSLRSGVLTADEFLAQARITEEESRRQFRYLIDRFEDGLLFYYFGHIDQVSHMMWRAMDPEHPAFTVSDLAHRAVVEDLYAGIDRLVGETASRLRPEDLLVVMSDHGFSSWRRAFSLNSWLRDNGYLAVRHSGDAAGTDQEASDLFRTVDWTATRAYGLGLNGLYLNVRGREAHGIVSEAERAGLAREIAQRLADVVDPRDGTRLVTRVYRREEVYRPGHDDLAPDLVVGYAKGTRVSDESAVGAVPQRVLMDNTDAWSGDHCMDPDAVPGVLLSTKALKRPAAGLEQLASALVAEFGVIDPRLGTPMNGRR
jgi:predicted AlkP superfamily phosphohydrolase/phosphomutase